MRFFLTTLLIVFVLSAKAEERVIYKCLSFDSEVEKDYRSFNFGAVVSQRPQEDSLYFSYGSFSFNSASSRFETNGEETVINNRDINGSLAVAYSENFEFLINGGQAISEETKFQKRYRNMELTFSKAGEQNSFPHFSLTAIFGSADIEQTISIKILNTTFTRTPELDQSVTGARFSFSPTDYLKFKLGVKAYTYSRSKEDLQKAYSSIFLNVNSTSLVSTIGGLPENSLDVGINYFINDLYSAEFFYGTSLLIITDNKDQRLGFTLTRFFESFSGNIGLSQNKTESQQSNSILIGAAIDF